MEKKICLLDPSLANHTGEPSKNLGDLIIGEAISQILRELGPTQISRVSSQVPFRREDCDIANRSSITILGGTNALTSTRGGHTFYWDKRGLFWLFPAIRQLVLLGVGWGDGYPHKPTPRMRLFYKRILDAKRPHSVRDEFTKKTLRSAGVKNVVNTGCPTTWKLNNQPNLPIHGKENCLFTLTDYNKDFEKDNLFVDLIANATPGMIHFYPQGEGDKQYIQMLASYERHKSRIKILERTHTALNNFLDSESNCFYAGTRLHCGIACLQRKWPSLILEIDNRAGEMGRDFNLPVINRNNIIKIQSWLRGEHFFPNITIPVNEIQEWKAEIKKSIEG